MKGFQAILAFVVGAGFLHGDDGPVDLTNEEFCTDVSQYSDKYYEEDTEHCCTTVYIPHCERKTKRVCMDVTSTICKPFAGPASYVVIQKNPGSGGQGDGTGDGGSNYGDDAANQTVRPSGPGDGNDVDGDGNDGGDGDGGRGNSGDGAPGTKAHIYSEYVELHDCKPVDVVLSHIKQVPECKPVTSLNCETGWKVVDGKKVWSGEEDCEEVTWQDCKLVDKEVPFHAMESRCGPANPPRESFLTCANKTVDVFVPVTRVSFVQGTTCKPETKRECIDMPYEDCSKPIRMEACSEVNVKKPKQDFIHKKKCFLPSDIESQVVPSPSSQQSEGFGNCEFTHDCRREENQHCGNIADASCICNHGTCVIRGHVWFGPHQSECKTLQDCKNSGKCSGVPDSQCFCIDEQCETGTQWECHETSDCGKMDKCSGKDCTCEDGACEWNCFADDDCNNGPFYCDPLGYHCKCQNSKCDRVKLPTQCKESSGDGLRECVEKNFCKKDEPCHCLQDFCTKPWYVEKNVAIFGGPRDFNCRTTQDCTDSILDCANGSCVCGNIVEHNWNKRGTCLKKSDRIAANWQQKPESAIRFPH